MFSRLVPRNAHAAAMGLMVSYYTCAAGPLYKPSVVLLKGWRGWLPFSCRPSRPREQHQGRSLVYSSVGT